MQDENESLPVWNDNEKLRSEPRAFSQDELVPCEKCKRVNPPTRTNCMYCGAGLPITEAAVSFVKPTLRQLEPWESGFSTVLIPDECDVDCVDFTKVAGLLRLDVNDVQALLGFGEALPLALCTSQEEAVVVQSRLADLHVGVIIVSDADLDANPLKRIRTVELTDDALIIHPVGSKNSQCIPWQDLSLIVAGRRVVRRLEVAERPDKRRGKEVVDSRELSSDAERLDIYSNQVESGWRIAADSFDYSCLREMKTLLASKNFQILINELRGRAPGADFDESYSRVRQSLSLVWPLEQRTESLGIHKPRKGRVNTNAATTSDNELQFARYSRLRHLLKLRKPRPNE